MEGISFIVSQNVIEQPGELNVPDRDNFQHINVYALEQLQKK